MLVPPFMVSLAPSSIRKAAIMGAFPMGREEGGFDWFVADPRGLLPVEGLRRNRSLVRALRDDRFDHSFDTCFPRVVASCRRPSENWINNEIFEAYCGIYDEGWGHSSEVWMDGRLVAGVYGVAIGGLFCAESMFHTEDGAGKVALCRLVEECKRQGFLAFDVQTMTPHLRWLGGYQVRHDRYLEIVREAVAVRTAWGGGPVET